MTKPDYFESERRKELPYLEAAVARYDMIFIDTSSIMSPYFARFAANIIPFLEKHNKRVTVCESVLRELKRLKQPSGDSEYIVREVYSYMGLFVLDKFIEHGVLEYVNDGVEDGPADFAFQRMFITLRTRRRLLLIAQDTNLSNTILRFNLDRSVYAEPIGVKQITAMGILDPRSKLPLSTANTTISGAHSEKLASGSTNTAQQTTNVNGQRENATAYRVNTQESKATPVKKTEAPVKTPTCSGAFTAKDAKRITGAELRVPFGHTSIGFIDRADVTMIILPDSVHTIGEQAFKGCVNLTHIAIPDTVTDIGASAFSNCVSLQTVKLPPRLTSVSNGAFRGCTSFKEINLHDGITHIGSIAFKGCVSLKRVVIPSSVINIGKHAFSSCPKLTIVCEPHSYAHEYALAHNVRFELTSSEPGSISIS